MAQVGNTFWLYFGLDLPKEYEERRAALAADTLPLVDFDEDPEPSPGDRIFYISQDADEQYGIEAIGNIEAIRESNTISFSESAPNLEFSLAATWQVLDKWLIVTDLERVFALRMLEAYTCRRLSESGAHLIQHLIDELGILVSIDQAKVGPDVFIDEPGGKNTEQSQKVNLKYDSTQTEDELARSPIAQALAVTLNNLYQQAHQESSDSLRVHLHGMWGSGKSTFLRLLSFALQPKKNQAIEGHQRYIQLLDQDTPNADWIIVNYNAWQQQRIEPVWWSLYETLYQHICDNLKESGTSGCIRRHRIQDQERKWRDQFRSPFKIATVISVALSLLAFLLIFTNGMDLGDSKNWIGLVTALFSLPAAIFSAYKLIDSQFPGGYREEMVIFARRNDDPLNEIRRHFKELVSAVEQPIMIYIDDLDRCNADHVIELLEVIQTVFNDSRVYYVIAADKRWVHSAYEIAYPDMKHCIEEPGKDMGALFLEKIFQLDLTIPEIDASQKQSYLAKQLQKERQDKDSPEDADVFDALGISVDENQQIKLPEGNDAAFELMEQLNEQPLSASGKQRLSQAISVGIHSKKSKDSISHFLEPYSDLLSNNPRAIKRYLNSYSLALSIALNFFPESFTKQDQRKKLALWMVISSRWPSALEPIRRMVRYAEPLDFGHPSLSSIDQNDFLKVWEGRIDHSEQDLDASLDKDPDAIEIFLRLTHFW